MNYTKEDFKYVITNQSITFYFDFQIKTVLAGEDLYDQLKLAIEAKDWNSIPALLSVENYLSAKSNFKFKVEDGIVLVDTDNGWWSCPSDLNDTIIKFMKNNLSFDYLVKFAQNLSKNPSPRSIQQLFSFLTKNKFTICEDGSFVGYKSVSKKGTKLVDTYTKTISHNPGDIIKMSWEDVEDDPNITCARGAHAANLDYAKNSYPGDVIVWVKICPSDVVSVPTDYNNAKMRTRGYQVMGIFEKDTEFESGILETDVSGS